MKAENQAFPKGNKYGSIEGRTAHRGASRPEGIPAVPGFGESKKKYNKINKDEIMSNKAKCHLFQFTQGLY